MQVQADVMSELGLGAVQDKHHPCIPCKPERLYTQNTVKLSDQITAHDHVLRLPNECGGHVLHLEHRSTLGGHNLHLPLSLLVIHTRMHNYFRVQPGMNMARISPVRP
jgi:hypothetical protein